MAWTKQRLEEAVRQRLDGLKLVAVANREPYISETRWRSTRETAPMTPRP